MCNSHVVSGSRTGAARGPFRELSYRVLNLPYCTVLCVTRSVRGTDGSSGESGVRRCWRRPRCGAEGL